MAVQLDGSARLSQACNTAHSKCRVLLKPIMEEVRALGKTNLGQYDACGLSKPIYSVAALVARSPPLGTRADFLVCLKVLQQTRWVYSDHVDKVADLRLLWSVSRDELLHEPSGSQSLSPLDNVSSSSPVSSIFQSPSPTRSARSRGSAGPESLSSQELSSMTSGGGSFCIPEGHNSPDDDVPSRKSPSRLAGVLSKWRREYLSAQAADEDRKRKLFS